MSGVMRGADLISTCESTAKPLLVTCGDRLSQDDPHISATELLKGPENKVELSAGADAVRGLLGNILFFARGPGLVKSVFDAAFDFVSHVPVRRLTFVPDAHVWELII